MLTQRGANLKHTDKYKNTLLHTAAEYNNLCAEFLLQNGADPLAKNKFGRTPIKVAQAKGHEEMVQLLDTALKSNSIQVEDSKM
jgi:ankyrin repeat protein